MVYNLIEIAILSKSVALLARRNHPDPLKRGGLSFCKNKWPLERSKGHLFMGTFYYLVLQKVLQKYCIKYCKTHKKVRLNGGKSGAKKIKSGRYNAFGKIR